jgi:nucleoside-diphosphate-sugar epimerase
MHVFVTGGTGHSGPYIISDLIAAGHEVTALARSDKAAAAVSALGAKARLGSLEDLDGLKEAAAASDGVIHVAHRQDLIPVGGINAVADAELQIMLAYGEALAGTGKPLVSSGSIGSPGWENLGRPATEEDPPLPGGDPYKYTLRVRNVVETTVIGLAEKGVRSSVVRIPEIMHSTTDNAGFLPLLIGLAKEKGASVTPETVRTGGPPCTPATSPPCSAWRLRRAPPAETGTRLQTRAFRTARSPRPSAVA